MRTGALEKDSLMSLASRYVPSSSMHIIPLYDSPQIRLFNLRYGMYSGYRYNMDF